VEAAIADEGGFILEKHAARLMVVRTDRRRAARPRKYRRAPSQQVAGGLADAGPREDERRRPIRRATPTPRAGRSTAGAPSAMASWPDGELAAEGDLEHGADRGTIDLRSVCRPVPRRTRPRTRAPPLRDDAGDPVRQLDADRRAGVARPGHTVEVGGTARIFAASGTYDRARPRRVP
jgi:hypothetical protein